MARPNRRIERRAEILVAARVVAVTEGAAGTTLRAIATAAGMEPSAVLYYFDGVGELVQELVFSASDRFIENIRAAVSAAGDPISRLEAAIWAGSTGGLGGGESRILYEFWSHGLRDPVLSDAERTLEWREAAIYREILEEGTAQGLFRPRLELDAAATALVALENGLVMEILAGNRTNDDVVALIRSVAETMLDVVLGALPAPARSDETCTTSLHVASAHPR